MSDEQQTGKVFPFPGVSLRDACQQREDDNWMTSKELLERAIAAELEDVVIAGVMPDGSMWVGSEVGEIDATIGKLYRAAVAMTRLP